MNDNERAMYTGVAMSRNTEVTLRWARSQMFILLHSAAFSFLITRTQPGIYLAMGCVGLLLAIVWLAVIERTEKFVIYWQSRLRALELSQENPAETQVYADPQFREVYADFPTFHFLLILLPILTILGWIGMIMRGFFLVFAH